MMRQGVFSVEKGIRSMGKGAAFHRSRDTRRPSLEITKDSLIMMVRGTD
jgi:hypothetical protein